MGLQILRSTEHGWLYFEVLVHHRNFHSLTLDRNGWLPCAQCDQILGSRQSRKLPMHYVFWQNVKKTVRLSMVAVISVQEHPVMVRHTDLRKANHSRMSLPTRDIQPTKGTRNQHQWAQASCSTKFGRRVSARLHLNTLWALYQCLHWVDWDSATLSGSSPRLSSQKSLLQCGHLVHHELRNSQPLHPIHAHHADQEGCGTRLAARCQEECRSV